MKLASCALIFAISVAVIGSHLSEAATGNERNKIDQLVDYMFN